VPGRLAVRSLGIVLFVFLGAALMLAVVVVKGRELRGAVLAPRTAGASPGVSAAAEPAGELSGAAGPAPRVAAEVFVAPRPESMAPGAVVSPGQSSPCPDAGPIDAFPDRNGSFWGPGRPYDHGSYGYVGVSRVITSSEFVRSAAGHGEEGLYAHQRVSVGGVPFHYRHYYGTGIYQARLQIDLHFAELEKSGPGERIFDVLLDGEPLVSGLDLYAVAGPHTAHIVSREVTVTYRLGAEPALDLLFVPRVGEACVAGVAIKTLSAIPQYTARAQVERSADDAHVIVQDGSYNREPFVRFGRYNDGFEYAAGLLCRRLMVPNRAFISSAWLEVWSYRDVGWQYGPADVTVYAQAADSARDFGWYQPRVTVRPLSAAGVRWVIGRPWPPDRCWESIDLAAAVQEVVDRPKWRPGNSLALLLMPNGGPIGWRDVVGQDWLGDSNTPGLSNAAGLHVTFVPPLYRPPKP